MISSLIKRWIHRNVVSLPGMKPYRANGSIPEKALADLPENAIIMIIKIDHCGTPVCRRLFCREQYCQTLFRLNQFLFAKMHNLKPGVYQVQYTGGGIYLQGNRLLFHHKRPWASLAGRLFLVDKKDVLPQKPVPYYY